MRLYAAYRMLHTVPVPADQPFAPSSADLRLPVRSSTAREVYATLRDAILAGAFAPDERLYESRLAEQLGISRTPVREALAMLEVEGFVLSAPNRGAVVRRIHPAEVRDTFDVRIVFEGHAARVAARRIDQAGLAELERLQAEMDERLATGSTDPDTMAELARLNARFHETVVAAAGNPVLFRVATGLIQTPLYVRAYFWLDRPLNEAAFADHTKLIARLGAGDAAGAERLWRSHLAQGRDFLLAHLECDDADANDRGETP